MENYLQKRYSININQESPIRIGGFTRRRHMLWMFNHLGFHKGAEIGVYKGENAESICVRLPGVKLICVDGWRAYDCYKPVEGFSRIIQPEIEYEAVKQRLSKYNVSFMRMDSMEAVKQIPLESLDFVYIDANHFYESVKEDLDEWSKRVRIGGIVSGHDYVDNQYCGVIPAVKDHIKEQGIKRWFVTGDRISPSYFWRKS
jgi:hypothetical protein